MSDAAGFGAGHGTGQSFENLAQATTLVWGALSHERLSPYRRASAADPFEAIQLYSWNAKISGAFFEVIGHAEVVVRNAMNRELARAFSGSTAEGQVPWFDAIAPILTPRARAEITRSEDRLLNRERVASAEAVIDGLGLGFWRYLLSARYEASLWTPALRHAFPHLHPANRRRAHEAVAQVEALRNRIVHLEPVHRRDLGLDAITLFSLLQWTDSAAFRWAQRVSRIAEVLGERPRRRPGHPANGGEQRGPLSPQCRPSPAPACHPPRATGSPPDCRPGAG